MFIIGKQRRWPAGLGPLRVQRKGQEKANQAEINIKEPFTQALGASSFKG